MIAADGRVNGEFFLWKEVKGGEGDVVALGRDGGARALQGLGRAVMKRFRGRQRGEIKGGREERLPAPR